VLAAVARDPSIEVSVDVDRRIVEVPALGYAAAFPLDDASRARLLAGQDEIDLSLAHAGEIASYEARRHGWLPRLRTPSG